jgi:hypothetical protein
MDERLTTHLEPAALTGEAFELVRLLRRRRK